MKTNVTAWPNHAAGIEHLGMLTGDNEGAENAFAKTGLGGDSTVAVVSTPLTLSSANRPMENPGKRSVRITGMRFASLPSTH